MGPLRDKCRYALAHGVEAAWIIDPYAGRIERWDTTGEPSILTRDDTLTWGGLSVDVAAIIDAD